MNIIKKIKNKASEIYNNMTIDDIHCVFNGVALAAYVCSVVQAVQIVDLKTRVGHLETICDTAFKTATNNDFKAFNNHMLNARRIDAIIQALKSTHPGIAEMVNDAEQVAVDNYLALPYDT